MQKDLKGEAARQPAANLSEQQRKLERFRHRHKHERPHAALDDDFPTERGEPSKKKYSRRLWHPAYPGQFEFRRVSACGAFRLQSVQYSSSNALKGEEIGLE